ncbi:MAG: T9SS type A sorting domain-containing protein, partial [Bacteroidales bacterium]|nr:T9SS type A sorting domain-containing protein [Bacteroidales bacterium]
GDHPEENQNDEILIKKLGNGSYEMVINSDRSGEGLVSIYAVSGQNVMTKKVHLFTGSNSYRFDLSRFADGLYLIFIVSDAQRFSTKLIHKN